MNEAFKAALIVFLVTLILILGAFLGGAIGCEERAVSFDDHKYSILAGCMVEKDGKWIPLENIRDFN